MRNLLLLLPVLAACSSTNNWPVAPEPQAERASDAPADTAEPSEVLGVEELPLVCAVRNGADGRSLLLGLWEDGRLVWSADPVFGGAPYREAQLDPMRVDGVLRCFALLFDRWDGEVLEQHPPGAEHVELICSVGGQDRRMASWHEQFEADEGLVVTQDGVLLLDGRSREEVLAASTSDYLRFRVLWNDVRRVMAGLAPPEARQSSRGSFLLPAPR